MSTSASASGDAGSIRKLATSGNAAGAGVTSSGTSRPSSRSCCITATGNSELPKPERAMSIMAPIDEKKLIRRSIDAPALWAMLR